MVQSTLDSSLKKVAGEEKNWIPACAGMTDEIKKGKNPIRLTAQG